MDYNAQLKRLENLSRAKAYSGLWEEAEFFTEVKKTLEKLISENECLHQFPKAGREALTLEQLREMDGQPVWVKYLINDKPGEWCILRVVQMSKTWFLACAGSEQAFGDKDTYGETWLAYAYPSAHIDRSNWKLCFTCRSCTSCKNITWLEADPNSPCRRCYEKNKYKPRNFCPDCGRPLTDEAWDMLEKRLRG